MIEKTNVEKVVLFLMSNVQIFQRPFACKANRYTQDVEYEIPPEVFALPSIFL